MKLEGTYTFDAPNDIVWEALLDPEVLAKVMPGCEKLEQTGQDEYETALKIKVGPVQGKFQGSVKLSDINAPQSYQMQVEGKGPAGFMKGVGQVQLESQGDSTLMHYTGEAQVGGRIASVGQRLLDSSAKALTRQSLDGLHQQIKARLQAAPETNVETSSDTSAASAASPNKTQTSMPEVKAPTQTEFAIGVARNMLEDMLPPERRPIVIAGGLGILALILLLNWWMNVVATKAASKALERRYS